MKIKWRCKETGMSEKGIPVFVIMTIDEQGESRKAY